MKKKSQIGTNHSDNTDLYKKILFTLFLLVIYRLGSYIPLPGVNVDVLNGMRFGLGFQSLSAHGEEVARVPFGLFWSFVEDTFLTQYIAFNRVEGDGFEFVGFM